VTRLLGIDLGEKRVGLALGDTEVGLARPFSTIRRSRSLDEDAAVVARVIDEQHVEELVVGLPLEASGEEGPMAVAARQWAADISIRVGLPAVLRDERLTSHLAEQRLGPMKRGRSGGPPGRTQRLAYRERVDREAAAILLQDELDARAAAARVGGMREDERMDGPEMPR
jgi:putative holliday junction resolvase